MARAYTPDKSGGLLLATVAMREQVEAMIAALDPTERALGATAFYAGLRRGELIGLRRSDLDLATGVIHVRRGWDTVEGEIAPNSRQGRRGVPVAAIVREHLDQHLIARADDGDAPAFGSPRWIGRTNDRARERWRDRGLPEITLHSARHVFASFATAAGSTRRRSVPTWGTRPSTSLSSSTAT